MLITTLTSLITIVMVPLGGIIDSRKCGEIASHYNHTTKVISLCEGVQGDLEFYKYHEVAHFYYFNILGSIQKEQYHKEYLKAYSEGKGSFYRDYGYNSEIEDFADNASLLFTKKNSNPPVMRRIRLIKKFLRDTSI